MSVYRMRIAFNGSRYAGWQRQPGLNTVQQRVEEVLRSVFRDDALTVAACGRTDAGVHALDMTLSFRTEAEATGLQSRLKQRLPHDIRLLEIAPAPDDFNAHKSALGKAYAYAVSPGEPNIFLRGLCWNWIDMPITEEVRTALKLLRGTHDFRFFTGRHTEGNTVRTLFRTELIEFGPLAVFYFSGDGFLYKMVRRMMGFLYETARGKHTAAELEEHLNRPELPPDDLTVAPPEGLYLKKTFYQPDEWRRDRVENLPFLM